MIMDYDSFDNLPKSDKIGVTNCLGTGRIMRPTCTCCGGSNGVRRAWRKYYKFPATKKQNYHGYANKSRGNKPKHKDKR